MSLDSSNEFMLVCELAYGLLGIKRIEELNLGRG